MDRRTLGLTRTDTRVPYGTLVRSEGKRVSADPDSAWVGADERNIGVRYEYLPVEEVVAGLRNRSAMKHGIVTGRNAPEALIEAADLVTEMVQVKHPFRSGVKAQRGIEF